MSEESNAGAASAPLSTGSQTTAATQSTSGNAAPQAAPAPSNAPQATEGQGSAQQPSQPSSAPSTEASKPTAQEAGDAVAQAMQDQGVENASDLDWSRKVTVTVDGNDRQVPLSELRGNYELRRTSHQRMEEAAKLRKQAEAQQAQLAEIAKALRDPSTAPYVLRELGYTPQQLQAVQDAIAQELALPEDQIRMRELEKREAQIRAREEAYNKRLREAQLQQRTQQAHAQLSKEIDAALTERGLAGHQPTITRMAQIMERALDANYRISAAEAADMVIEEMRLAASQSLSGLSPDQLKQVLGEEALEALRAERVAELKRKPREPAPAPRPKPVAKAPPRRIGSIDPSEYFNN